MEKGEISALLSPILPPFDQVFTGYSSHREPCHNTAAWGLSEECVIFADWNGAGIVTNIWTNFFDGNEEAISAATQAVMALGSRYPLLYTDWAWGTTTELGSEEAFRTVLTSKLKKIEENIRNLEED